MNRWFNLVRLFCVLIVLIFTCLQSKAQHTSERSKPRPDTGSVVASVLAADKLSIFERSASYTVSLKNTYERDQDGTLSYQVLSESGEKLKSAAVPVKLSRLGVANYHFDLPEMGPGFYKVNFLINVSDYDDTVKRAFGISPQEIKNTSKRPADFDAFWQKAKTELATVKTTI